MTDDFIYVGGEILPCPFCSNDGMIYLSGQGKNENGEIEQYYSAECSVCGVGFHEDFKSYADALEVWNRR